MEKKLPSVFANKISKEINNNEKVYSTKKEDVKEEKREEKIKEVKKDNKIIVKKNKENKLNQPENEKITKKINEIFKTKKYIYKIPVKIKTNDDEYIKNIIGKNSKNLITIENELINIESIKDINVVEQEKNE